MDLYLVSFPTFGASVALPMALYKYVYDYENREIIYPNCIQRPRIG